MTSYAGTWPLARAALRRDRVLASVWVLLLVVVVYASAAATESLYPTAADRVSAAEAINDSPAIVALYGPILDVTSAGELAMTKLTVLYAVFAALLFLVLVRRHTRTEEESGRAELLGGTAVGRDAQLAAAVLESALVALTPRRAGRAGVRGRRASGHRARSPSPRRGSASRGSPSASPRWPASCRRAHAPAPPSRARASASSTCCGWSATPDPAGCRGSRRSAGPRG